jgi:hypothetical protein
MAGIKSFIPKSNGSAKDKKSKGTFDEYNPKKYVGSYPIIYRSSWELKFMRTVEFNSNVKSWTSESVCVPYVLQEKCKKTGKIISKRHNYYPDFTVILHDGKKFLVEVKPKSQSPTANMDMEKIKRSPVLWKNFNKWLSAVAFCKLNGYRFIVVTEDHLKTKIF